MDNIKVTLTPTELGDIIDNAFNLGKVYAADELSQAGYDEIPTPKASGLGGTLVFLEEWRTHVESKGGMTFSSGDAKLDILWEAVAMNMRDSLKNAVEY